MSSVTAAASPSVAKGPKVSTSLLQRKLLRLGLQQPADFVMHLPLRYEDETQVSLIASLHPGMHAQIEGDITHSEVILRPRRQLIAQIRDHSGTLNLRWLNFYPNQLKQLQAGKPLRVRGEVRRSYGPGNDYEIVHPKVVLAGSALPAALTPIYPTTEGLSQISLRKAIGHALAVADLSDTLPDDVLVKYGLQPFNTAIHILHHPPADISYANLMARGHPAWHRIKFDELLAQQLSMAAARAARRKQRAIRLDGRHSSLGVDLLQNLSFRLTNAQQRVIDEINHDLARDFPMHRLLQGDVGSGKTIVAALAAISAISGGCQVALMAPTEILAEQHYQKMCSWLDPLGIRVSWLTGSLRAKQRQAALLAIENGQAQLVVGTQALIQDKVNFSRLGLVILDEQHRFGVGQRLQLSRKGDTTHQGVVHIPHQLNMSATPIPRTLAMSFFADLDVSVIDELPPGRTPVITKLIDDARREQVIIHVQTEVRAGRQAYWVCPLIEESEALQLQTAIETHEHLQRVLHDMRVGLIHGRMPTEEKQQLMEQFRAGGIDLLVATTVIEVGVDVPNASLMIIEHAERFGLAQLHQLRGRVGRGSQQSVCVLLYQKPLSAIARQRLRIMYSTDDGFEIARQDLALRGPGEFLGLRQSGQELLRFADLDTDNTLLDQAQEAAKLMRQSFPKHTQAHLQRWMRGKQDLLRS